MYLFIFVICFTYPLILWQAKSIWIYLIAMALWGLYYDLHNYGTFDFVGLYTEKKEHSSSFGVIQVFQALGYMLAPLFAGLLISEVVGPRPFILSYIFLVLALIFFLLLLFFLRKEPDKGTSTSSESRCPNITFLKEFRLLKKVGYIILPVLCLTLVLNIIDAFFWTVGPLLAESLVELKGFEGLFMVAYSLPFLMVGWFVGGITKKLGKKRTAIISVLIGSAILSILFLIQQPMVIILVTFIASFFIALAWPANNGSYADYITETPLVEKEIEGVTDFYTNIGYVIGPILAGYLAENVGNIEAFSILGLIGLVAAVILLKVTPKSINLNIKRRF